MASQPALDPDVDRIREALAGLLAPGRPYRIEFIHGPWPFLRAILVSDDFEGMHVGQRQEWIWSRLRDGLDAKLNSRLFSVYPCTWNEARNEFEETDAGGLRARYGS